jgi:hypothetical protein
VLPQWREETLISTREFVGKEREREREREKILP